FDEVEAVLALQIGVVRESLARLKALHEIRTRPEFGSLSNSFKRALNIVRDAYPKGIMPVISANSDSGVRVELLQDPSEKMLFDTFQDIRHKLEEHIQLGGYDQALQSMVSLRDPLDQFFKGVMVMTDD